MRNEDLLSLLIELGGSGSITQTRNELLNSILIELGGTSIGGSQEELLEAILVQI